MTLIGAPMFGRSEHEHGHCTTAHNTRTLPLPLAPPPPPPPVCRFAALMLSLRPGRSNDLAALKMRLQKNIALGQSHPYGVAGFVVVRRVSVVDAERSPQTVGTHCVPVMSTLSDCLPLRSKYRCCCSLMHLINYARQTLLGRVSGFVPSLHSKPGTSLPPTSTEQTSTSAAALHLQCAMMTTPVVVVAATL